MSGSGEDFAAGAAISVRSTQMPPPTPLSEDVRSRLSRVVGAARAQTLIQETLKKAGIPSIVTPQDMFAFATLLEVHGGSVAVVASAIKMRALLRGATPG